MLFRSADCDEAAIFAQIQGLDNRVVRMIDHATFYDKMPMSPVNIKREHACLRQEEAERRHVNGVSLWASSALGCLTAMAGADVAIGLYERWVAKRLGVCDVPPSDRS